MSKGFKIAHISDIHADKKNMVIVNKAVEFTVEKLRELEISAAFFSGDIFNGNLSIADAIFILETLAGSPCPLHFLQGTPSHDIPGSIKIFDLIKSHLGQYNYTFDKPETLQLGRPNSPIGMIHRLDNFDSGDVEECGQLSVLPAVSKGNLALNQPDLGPAELNAEARNQLQNILKDFGLKAEGRHPHILMLHYPIEGAGYSNGQMETGNEITLSIADLQLANADYVAAGHIHKAQQENLPYWVSYAGSLVHQDAGEQEPKGFKVVTFDDNGKLDNIEFIESPSLPVQVVDVTIENGKIIYSDDINPRAKVKVRITGQTNEFTPDVLGQVTTHVDNINTDNTIVKIPLPQTKSLIPEYDVSESLVDKIKKYCDARDLTLTDSALLKVDKLVEGSVISKKFRVPTTGGLEITKLRIRGAHGLLPYGEEIEIDLSKFDQGPIALSGVNGAGKTTILENCHPWPKLVSRKDALKHHFYLNNSFRELHFNYNGEQYKSKILISANKTECYLYMNDKLLNEEGTQADYLKELEDRLCSPEIFFKLIFQGQESDKLAELTATPLKKFFNALFGLDVYPAYFKDCKGLKEDAEKLISGVIAKIEEINAQIELLQGKVSTKSEIEFNQEKREVDLEKANEAKTEFEKEHKALTEKAATAKTLTEAIAELEISYNQDKTEFDNLIKEKAESIKGILATIETIGNELSVIETRLETKTELLPLIAEHGKLQETIDAISESIEGYSEEINTQEFDIEHNKTKKESLAQTAIDKQKPIRRQWIEETAALKALQNKLLEAEAIRETAKEFKETGELKEKLDNKQQTFKELSIKLESAEYKLSQLKVKWQTDIVESNNKIDNAKIKAKLLSEVPCREDQGYTLSCKLLKDANESANKLTDLRVKEKGLEKRRINDTDIFIEVKRINKAIDDLKYESVEHSLITLKYDTLKAKNPVEALNEVENAESVMTEKEKLIKTLTANMETIESELIAAVQVIDTSDEITIKLLESAETEHSNSTNVLNRLKSEIEPINEKALPLIETLDIFDVPVTTVVEKRSEIIKTTYEKLELQQSEKNKSLEIATKSKTDKEAGYDERLKKLIESTNENGGKIKAKKSELETIIGDSKIDCRSIQDVKNKVELEQATIDLNKEEITKLKTQLEAIVEFENEIKQHQERLSTEEDNRSKINTNVADWDLLLEVFGKNGLQAVELSAACPEVSDIATAMLRQFGKDWAINIRPLKDSADGKSELDDFTIIVSTETGVKEFNKFSGGEKVWIEESLKKAGIIYMMNNTGYAFKTVIQDEADGALAEDSAQAFLAIALKAHELIGAHHTLIVSHRPSILNAVTQQIKLNPEEGKIEFIYG